MASEREVLELVERFEKAVVRHERNKSKNSDADREYDGAKLALMKALRRS